MVVSCPFASRCYTLPACRDYRTGLLICRRSNCLVDAGSDGLSWWFWHHYCILWLLQILLYWRRNKILGWVWWDCMTAWHLDRGFFLLRCSVFYISHLVGCNHAFERCNQLVWTLATHLEWIFVWFMLDKVCLALVTLGRSTFGVMHAIVWRRSIYALVFVEIIFLNFYLACSFLDELLLAVIKL